MNTLSAGEVLQARYASFKQKQFNDDASIENTVGNTTNNTSIELPQEIKELITGNEYWVNAKTNRYKKLITGRALGQAARACENGAQSRTIRPTGLLRLALRQRGRERLHTSPNSQKWPGKLSRSRVGLAPKSTSSSTNRSGKASTSSGGPSLPRRSGTINRGRAGRNILPGCA